MKIIRKILFPLGIIYWLVTYLRNKFFDYRILKSTSFSLPIIAIGNLSVGGTGKTPHTEYIIRLLKDHYKLAILSRGYKRVSKGYILANDKITSEILGDESFQIFQKFSNVHVAVCEDRRLGISNLINQVKPEVILLDDAFQHRKVKAGFYVLLTAFDDLFCDDFILPFGNLRESSMGKNRADVIIVTKCPPDLSQEEMNKIEKKINVAVSIYFTCIQYDEFVYNDNEKRAITDIKKLEKNIVVGIAKPEYFVDYIKTDKDHIKIYPDHHNFTNEEIIELNELAQLRPIITTEKDYVRLKGKVANLFYLPIQVSFIKNESSFNQKILDYVG